MKLEERLFIALTITALGLIIFVLEKIRIVKKTNLYLPLLVGAAVFYLMYLNSYLLKFIESKLKLTEKGSNVMFNDWGGGLFGLLMPCLELYLFGKYLLKINFKEQFGGTTNFTVSSLKHGLIAGVEIAVITLLVVFLIGQKFGFKTDTYRYTINIVTNFYEEFLCRGLVLACCLKYWNKISGIIWTSIIFGLLHGINEKALFVMLTSWIMARAIVRAKSLWAGWTAHQSADMLIDTILA